MLVSCSPELNTWERLYTYQAAAGAATYLMMADHTLDSKCSLVGFGRIACWNRNISHRSQAPGDSLRSCRKGHTRLFITEAIQSLCQLQSVDDPISSLHDQCQKAIECNLKDSRAEMQAKYWDIRGREWCRGRAGKPWGNVFPT